MKAQELIKKIKALREAFGENESQELIDRLLSGQDIEYESPQELKELYGLVGDKSPVREDYKAYVGLKQKPNKFTSRELQRLYEQELLSDPLYRVRRLEERVKELEERIATLEALLGERSEEEKPEEEPPEEEKGEELEEAFWGGKEKREQEEAVWEEGESEKEKEVEEEVEKLLFNFSPYGIAEEEENERESWEEKEEKSGKNFVGFTNTVEEEVENKTEEVFHEVLQYQGYQVEEKKEEEDRPLSVEDFSSVVQEELPRKSTGLEEETTLPEVFIPTTESEAERGEERKQEKKEGKTVPVFTLLSSLNLAGLILKRVL